MAKQKYYVVWKGRTPGIYTRWEECKAQIHHFPGARYKAFSTKEEAERAYKEEGYKEGSFFTEGKSHKSSKGMPSPSFYTPDQEIDFDSISVDVGTRGNPGPVEYKGVDTRTGEVIFSYGPIPKGTNNLGEFLAIVHALAYLKKIGSKKTVYSDSRTALKWVREKKVSSELPRDSSTEEIWRLVDRAEKWLKQNTYENKVLKWDTERWGEIKADYGRKSGG
ncbi:MAG: ribonuclease H family protein [Thermicanus sp.]|nr:ribonuclease H family protein [Thermicanus sp.]